MTLKEKFDKISCKDCDMPYCDIRCTILSEKDLNKLEQIADEFAIEFVEWCDDNYFRMGNNNIWLQTIDFESPIKFTTKELLEIFKKEREW